MWLKTTLTAEEITETIGKLDEPGMIIQQTERTKKITVNGEKVVVPAPDNFVAFVTLESGKECVAVIEFDSVIDPKYIVNDGKGEEFHTTVTVFEPDVVRDGMPFDNAEYLLSKSTNRELDIIKESENGTNSYTIKDSKGTILSEVKTYNFDIDNFDWTLMADVTTQPEHRGRGLATKLINKAYNDIGSEKGMYLFVKKSNSNAIRLYEKLKYVNRNGYSVHLPDYYRKKIVSQFVQSKMQAIVRERDYKVSQEQYGSLASYNFCREAVQAYDDNETEKRKHEIEYRKRRVLDKYNSFIKKSKL